MLDKTPWQVRCPDLVGYSYRPESGLYIVGQGGTNAECSGRY